MASHQGHVKIVELLLANGADRHVTDSTGKAAEDLAKESGHEDIVTLLNNAKHDAPID